MLLILFALQATLAAKNRPFEVQGHRGMRGLFPENSLPGFQAAIEAGVDAVELDLLLTKDGQIVIQHNYMLDAELCHYFDGQPINETRFISALLYSDIRKCDCGAKKNPLYQRQRAIHGTHIPTLGELFHLIENSEHPNAKRMRLNLEIKADPANPHFLPAYSTVAEKIVQAVQEAGFAERVAYSSFDPHMLAEVNKLVPEAPLGFIFNERTLLFANQEATNWIDYVRELASTLNIKVVSPDYCLVTQEAVEAMHTACLRVIPWTVNDLEISKALIDMGVDGIISDYPIDIMEAFHSHRTSY